MIHCTESEKITLSQGAKKRMSDEIFKQYDIRGKVGSELVIEEAYNLARAISYYLKEKNPSLSCIALGADGRTHSPALTHEICRGLQDSGLDVIFVGTCPTPVLYFALYVLPVQAGLMITASHNTKEYNGIKIMLDKKSVWADEIQMIKKYYIADRHIQKQEGLYTEHVLVDEYISWLSDHFSSLQGMELSAVIDCGNGAAGIILPKLSHVMKWKRVKLLYPEVDGTYPNHTADPVVKENMQEVQRIVQETDCQIGIGLDGDADRMAAVTKSGDLIVGDKLLALFVEDVRKKMASVTVVYDLKCSSGLRELLQKWNIPYYVTPTGHAWVKEYMHKYNAVLGGELSCHLFFADRYFGFDDGIYAMMRLFELLVSTGKSLDELVTVFPHKISSSEIRFGYPDGKRDEIIDAVTRYFKEKNARIMTIDGVHVTFDNGWGIIRVSNTQPVLSIRFEADTQKDFDMIQQEFLKALEYFYKRDFLQIMLSQ